MSQSKAEKLTPVSRLKPRAADAATIVRLQQPQEEWPKGLFRFAMLKRFRDGENVRYRAICWNAVDRQLHVLKLVPNGAPMGPGEWYVWSADAPDSPLKDIRRADESVVPEYMTKPLTELPKELKKGLNGHARRRRIVQAFCSLDVGGKGQEEDMMFNDDVVVNTQARLEAQRFVRDSLGKPHGWESHIRKLFHQFCHFGGANGAMLAQHNEKGGRIRTRVGTLKIKPGRLSDEEERAKRRSEVTGKPVKYRRPPTNLDDEKKFVDVLTRYWANKRFSLGRTYAKLCLEHYADVDEREIPTVDTFRYHSRRLIVEHDLVAVRNRTVIHEQYYGARVGTATDYTQGKIEIVDVDGFTPKIFIRVKVRNKWKTTQVKVIFAVSRNTHAVLAAEIVLRGESAVAYRRCIASCFLSKAERAKELGLESSDGLVHGNIDGVFVDNGAGPAKENVQVACGEMRLSYELAPPGRGDYKPVGENLNSLMVQFCEEEASGHNRKHDKVQQEERRRARRARGVSIRQLETLIYKAMQHHNLTADRSYLRGYAAMKEGWEGTPAQNFEASQLKRRGDARREWTERDVLARFVPWKKYKVRRGLVYFKRKVRYTSADLVTLWNNHVKIPKEQRRPLIVSVKRLEGSPHCLIWKMPNREEGLLKLIEADAMRIRQMSWAELDMTLEATSMLKPTADSRRRASRDRVTVEQDELITAREQVLQANGDVIELEGTSISDAKARATAQFDRKWGDKEAAAAGIDTKQLVAPMPTETSKSTAADQAYAARIREKKLARSRGVGETHLH
ncbi:hypothetical protein A6V36_30485 [Paraburkholderia ginsengiterrae]|uniref:Uncharacterized protein n=1 Tax=Paraburkholderia ginsengiterrae TaxID=1462993 RepID=A0A1A9N316_9BURK|nr:hypothetical protein [Paraburkholderia ginsengiterrae]OAJ55969.1 hypothetical protein A6V37_32135 [Paraburkholderia ginsengiterrae]OAJ58572.1 hypothetical protein A6V36_30485 [Paraburkholderia ginsengiterrae]